MRGLYAIIDTATLARHGLEPLPFAEALLDVRPAAIQLRDKRGSARDTLSLLRELAPIARRAGVPLFANDRPDLAALARCDGVHLGQHDLPPAEARRVFEALGVSAAIGMSVHDRDELAVALAAAPDYIAFGPVYDTISKTAAEPTIGIDGLRRLTQAARAQSAVPFVAIGGIDLDRAPEVAAVCPCAAIISDLCGGSLSYDAVRGRAAALNALLQ